MTWVQCTTESNECLGGCRSMAEHDRYRHQQLLAEVENLRPLVVLHEDMTRMKREAEAERDELLALCRAVCEALRFTGPGNDLPNAAIAVRTERDAALADNAELVRHIWFLLDHPRAIGEAPAETRALLEDEHPGAAILERVKRLEVALAPIAAQARAIFDVHHPPPHCVLGLSLTVADGERVLATFDDH